MFVHEGEVDRATDLAQLRSKVGCVYEIKEVGMDSVFDPLREARGGRGGSGSRLGGDLHEIGGREAQVAARLGFEDQLAAALERD